jgi:hypothetical protein
MPRRFRRVPHISADLTGYGHCKPGGFATATEVTQGGSLFFLFESFDAVTDGYQLAQSLRQSHATLTARWR